MSAGPEPPRDIQALLIEYLDRAPAEDLLRTSDALRVERPFANAALDRQRLSGDRHAARSGCRVFAQGDVLRASSVLGGLTDIDARLLDTAIVTDGGQIVGVPGWKTDVTLDRHPAFAHGAALTGAVHHQGPRAATENNPSFAPQFATPDLGLRYSTKRCRRFVTAVWGPST